MKKISHKLAVLCAACFLGMLLLGLFCIYSINSTAARIRATESKTRVDGDLYNRIVQDKDVLADVLPPPAYVLESYLVTLQLSDTTNRAESDKLRGQLGELQKEFNDSFSHWQKELPDGKLKESFLKAGEPAVQFYDIVNREFLPGLDRGDYAKAKGLVKTSLLEEYTKQRAAIDGVVAGANEESAAQTKELQDLLKTNETEVAGRVRLATSAMVMGIILALLATAGLALLFSTKITKVLGLLAAELRQGAEQTTAAADQVSSASQSLAEGASEQAASLEETSSSLEEMAGMTRNNAERAGQCKHWMAEARVIVGNVDKY